MFEFLNDLNPIVVDVVVVAILVLTAFFGAIKGVKKTLLSFIILGSSFFLGFCSYTNGVKSVITNKLLDLEKFVPAGGSSALIFGAKFFNSLVASIVLFLLFYIVLHVVFSLFGMIIKRKFGEAKEKSVLSRVLGAIISAAYCGAFFLVVLFCLNTNTTGMRKTLEKTSVANFIIDKSESLLNKVDERFVDKLVFKIYSGDLLKKVDEKTITAFIYMEDNVVENIVENEYIGVFQNDVISSEEIIKLMKERVDDLHNLAVVSKAFNDTNPKLSEKFALFAEDVLKEVNRQFKDRSLEPIEYKANELGVIMIDLKDAGLSDNVLKLLEEITIGK